MGKVLIRRGDILEGGLDLTVLPCSAKGTVSTATRRWLTLFGIPMPKDAGMQLQLGSLSDVIDFPGPKHVTKYVVFAASVLNDFSSPEVIESIGQQLGRLTHTNTWFRQIETPLLGTGAGGLATEIAGSSLYKGFRLSAVVDSTLYILVFDSERQTSLTNLIREYETVYQSKLLKRIEKPLSILFLAADPTDASRLRLGEELREIHERLQLAKLRGQFELHPRMSVRPVDISQALLDVQPRIVHFSGHGTATGTLCFENQIGSIQPIQSDALAALFEQFAGQVNCVVLNACYSEIQADAIAKHIDYVVGMSQAIGDKAAIAFAVGFYQALGACRAIEEAYKLGCVQIRLQGIAEHLTPVLIKRQQA